MCKKAARLRYQSGIACLCSGENSINPGNFAVVIEGVVSEKRRGPNSAARE
jgi:hypothetical protein